MWGGSLEVLLDGARFRQWVRCGRHSQIGARVTYNGVLTNNSKQWRLVGVLSCCSASRFSSVWMAARRGRVQSNLAILSTTRNLLKVSSKVNFRRPRVGYWRFLALNLVAVGLFTLYHRRQRARRMCEQQNMLHKATGRDAKEAGRTGYEERNVQEVWRSETIRHDDTRRLERWAKLVVSCRC